MLFNEPKLLKCTSAYRAAPTLYSFSALQRAEIAEISMCLTISVRCVSFSALQRAEIAEIRRPAPGALRGSAVSVLFNEPKLLKYAVGDNAGVAIHGVSVLFNEPKLLKFI